MSHRVREDLRDGDQRGVRGLQRDQVRPGARHQVSHRVHAAVRGQVQGRGGAIHRDRLCNSLQGRM